MKNIISLSILFFLSLTSIAADVKISQLPLGTGASVGVNDSFPYITGGITKRLTIYDLINVPLISTTFAPLASPTFTGVVTAPSFVGPLTGNASTATALAANPTDCSSGQYANAIAANGNLTCSAVTTGQLSGNIDLTTQVTGTLPAANGGTGQTSIANAFDSFYKSVATTLGDLVYGGASGAPTRLAGQTTATTKFLTQTGTGSASAAPSWTQPACANLSDATASCSTDTTNASNISSGALAVARGGTGQASYTKGDLLVTPGGTTVNKLAIGTDAQVLTADSASTNGLKWASAGTASPLTTKGDMYIYSTANARLPAGAAGQVVTPDSYSTNGVRWSNPIYRNYLFNPSFELGANADSGWTPVAGTDSADTTNFNDEDQALSISLSAVNGSVIYQDASPTVQMSGQNYEASVWVKTASTTVQVCMRNAGATVGSCTNVPGTDTWNLATVYYPGPSSGSIGIGIQTSSSTTGTVKLDKAYLGPARGVGTVAQATFYGSLTYTKTASCNWAVTQTTYAADFAANASCATPTVTGSITAPGTKLTQAVANNAPPGNYHIVAVFNGFLGTTSQTGGFRIVDDAGTQINESGAFLLNTSTTPFTLSGNISYTTAGNHTFKVQGISTSGTANIGADGSNGKDFSIYVYYFPSQSQIAVNTSAPTLPTIQKFTSGSGTYTTPAGVVYIKVRMVGGGGGGGGTGTGGQSAGGTGGTSTFGTTLLSCVGGGGGGANGAAAGAGGTASLGTGPIGTAQSGGSGSRAGNANGTVPVLSGGNGGNNSFGGGGGAASAGVTNTGGGGGGGLSGGQTTDGGGSGGGAGGYIDAIISTPLSTYSYAVGAAGAAGSAGTGGSPGNAGGSGYIEVTEYYSTNAPLLVGSVTSNSTGLEREERALMDLTSGTGCATSTQSGTWISSASRPAAGVCLITMASGMFSATPTCVCIAQNGGSGRFCAVDTTTTPSATALRIRVSNTADTGTDDKFNLICVGPR